MIKEVLTQAKQLISDPERWTSHTGARDSEDVPCAPDSPRAYKWCAIGAVSKTILEMRVEKQDAIDLYGWISRVLNLLNYPVLTYVNDVSGHAEVLRAMDLLIERA